MSLTLQGGQRVLVAVQDDGLLGSRCPRLLPLRAVQTLHVELEVPVTVEPAGEAELEFAMGSTGPQRGPQRSSQ